MIRFKTIHFKIFITYAILVASIIFIFLILYSINMSSILRQNASESLQQLSLTIGNNIDSELKNLSTIALKVISSDPIKKVFLNDVSNPMSRFSNEKELADLILSIEGPSKSFYKLNLYRNDGYRYEYGIVNNAFTKENAKEYSNKSWLNEALKLQGRKYISPPHAEPVANSSDTIVISICEAFAEVYGMKPDNIIDIQQSYTVFSNIVQNSIELPNGDVQANKYVFILDRAGNLIYPYEKAGSDSVNAAEYYWHEVNGTNLKSGCSIIRNPYDNVNHICAYTISDYSGWTTLLLEPEPQLFRPISVFNKNMLILGIVTLLITLLITYFLSKSLSTPIKKIKNSIRNLDLKMPAPQKPIELNTDIDELTELNNAYHNMRESLDKSVEEAVSSKSHEIQSRMLALQSQMNPHFLFNTLFLISIICDEKGVPEVVKICDDLSSMLRYIATESLKPVTLAQEIEHTEKFIQLIKQRYGDMLKFKINIPAEMLNLKVPKLIIQPIVENCVKYGMDSEPPWEIRVSGVCKTDAWEIIVTDNGKGFQEEKLTSIREKFAGIDVRNEHTELKLEGMGLMNIFIRMKLFFEDRMVFKIENKLDGGASVTIGGPMPAGEELL